MVAFLKVLAAVALAGSVVSGILSTFTVSSVFSGLLVFGILYGLAMAVEYFKKVDKHLTELEKRDTSAPIDRSGETIRCPKCGQEMPSNRYVCRKCGAMIE